MAKEGISRRDVLRTLAVGAASSSVLQVIPAAAAEPQLIFRVLAGEQIIKLRSAGLDCVAGLFVLGDDGIA